MQNDEGGAVTGLAGSVSMTTDRPTYPPRSRMLPSASQHPSLSSPLPPTPFSLTHPPPSRGSLPAFHPIPGNPLRPPGLLYLPLSAARSGGCTATQILSRAISCRVPIPNPAIILARYRRADKGISPRNFGPRSRARRYFDASAKHKFCAAQKPLWN